jgi:transcriptional antiterminator RfaH
MMGEGFWYTLYTKPHKEHAVHSFLQEQGLTAYLPEEPNLIQRRDRRSHRPFFPQYLFLQHPGGEFSFESIKWTPGLRTVVSFGGSPASIPDALIQYIQERLAERASRKDGPFRPGQKVRFVRGPFRGIEAVFDSSLSGRDRVRVLLDVVSRAQLSVEADIGDLDAADPSSPLEL